MSTACISVVHATRRGTAALRARDRWLDAAAHPGQIEWIFAVDEDDAATAAVFAESDRVIRSPGDGGSVAAWNAAAVVSTGEIIVQMSDDWTPAPQWDATIRERLAGREKSEAVLRISDGHRTDELICMVILTRAYYARYGRIFYPGYFSVYSDNDFTLQAERDGVIVEARDVVFEHNHPLFTTRLLDKVYRRSNAPLRYEHGRALFKSRYPGAVLGDEQPPA